jgi:hypothetical protein
MEWHLQPGETISRKKLHDLYGGVRQGGVSPSRTSSNIFLFTDRTVGETFGYMDHWEGEEFHYAGHGQRGDQEMMRGNLAILNHERDGRALRLVEGVRGKVRYIGEFELADDPSYIVEAPSVEGGLRKVIMFRLRPVE